MKKILFSALGAAALLVTGCAKNDLDATMVSGEMTNVTLSVAMDGASESRAIDNYGDASAVTRCILEVYTDQNELYKRMVVESDGKSAEFDLRLVSLQTYDFVAWADCGSGTDGLGDLYYVTTSLKAITTDFSNYAGSDEQRDAFFGKESVTGGTTSVTMELTRPFGQLNLLCDFTDILESQRPKSIKLKYVSVPNAFNAFDGSVSGTEELEWNDTTVVETSDVENAKGVHLATDYIFAPATTNGDQIVEFTATFTDSYDATTTNNKFANIPIRRNWRTNVSGEFLSNECKTTINILPGFDGTESVNITGTTTVASVADAQTFLDDYIGGEDIKVTIAEIDGDSSITVPASITTTAVTFVIESVKNTTDKLTVATTTTGDVTIDNQSGTAMGLDVTAESASVYVSGSYNSLSISSGPDTTYIAEGAVVSELTVNKGNVVLYGEAKSIVRGTDNKETVELTAYGTLGTFGEGVELVDGTIFYNETTGTQYSTFQALIGNVVANNVVFVGAGEHEYSTSIQKSLTIKGTNAGKAGYATDRKAETVILSEFYQSATATGNVGALTMVVDGVTLSGAAAFDVEGGVNLTLKNSIISSSSAKVGSNSENDRVVYVNGTAANSNVTITNNLFKPADGELNEIWLTGNNLKNGDITLTATVEDNVFDFTTIFAGSGGYTTEGSTNISIKNNTFKNISGKYTYYAQSQYDAYAVVMKPGSALPYIIVDGNTFEDSVANKVVYASASTWAIPGDSFYNANVSGSDVDAIYPTYSAALTESLGDWNTGDSYFSPEDQPSFADGKTTIKFGSSSKWGASENYANPLWFGTWNQSIDIFIDNANWVSGDNTCLGAAPSGANGAWAADHILSILKDDVGYQLGLSGNAKSADRSRYNSTPKDGSTNFVNDQTLDGWYTVKWVYYYEDATYKCDMSVSNTYTSATVISLTYSLNNAIGMSSNAYLWSDDDTTQFKSLVVKNQQVSMGR